MGYRTLGISLLFLVTLLRAAAQPCNTPYTGIINASNPDPYSAIGSASFATEGPPGGSCQISIAVSQGQRTVVLGYTETWFTYDFGCGMGGPGSMYCQNTITMSLSGPGIPTFTETLSPDGLTPPPSTDPPWVPVNDCSGGGTGEWTRSVYQIIDVSTAAQAAPISLQFQLSDSIPSYTGSATMQVQVFRFTMTPTASTFRPQDGRDTSVGCVGAQQGNCYPTYAASSSGFLQSPITFTLWLPNYAAGRYLVGTSTNSGADGATVPDYLFTQLNGINPGFNAPTAGGLSIQTSGAVDNATVTVSSQDFGGRALLAATSRLYPGGPTITADIFDPNSGAQPGQSMTIQGTCGPAGSPPYVNLPVDADCDGIADWWEDTYSKPQAGAQLPPGCTALSSLGHLPVNCDMEPGPVPGTSPFGDGYSVHDEYRGFHYVSDDGMTILWKSTDPMNDLDVFFWDQSNKFTIPLRQILDQQTPVFKFHRVTARQAHAKDPGSDPTKGANALNANSITTSFQQGFAVVYARQGLGGRGQFATLGRTPNSTNDGSAILIDTGAVTAFSVNSRFPAATLLAQVVAHESGHHFGQRHPLSQTCCNYVPLPAQLGSLTQDQFSLGANRSPNMYIRFSQYLDPFNVTRTAEGVDLSPFAVEARGMRVQVADLDASVFLVSLTGTLTAPAVGVGKAIQRLKIMDWTPNLNLTSPAQWQFDAGYVTNQGNLADLCVRKVCQR